MPKQSILVMEDDRDIAELLIFNLEAAGYDTLTAHTGPDGLDLARRKLPGMVILDIMLPGLDGFDVCRALKRDNRTAGLPVIMLTARGEELDRVVGLELGADDYVVKPFSFRELLLRIRAVMRRAPAPAEAAATAKLERHGLALDAEAHKVFLHGRTLDLTATEFKLLHELMQSAGRVRSREQLLDAVWGYRFEGYARTVDTHVRRLRAKLGEAAGFIETVRGVGYRGQE